LWKWKIAILSISVDMLSRQSIKERSGLLSRESVFARQNYNSGKEDCAAQSLRAMPNSSAAFQAAVSFGRVYEFWNLPIG
jgi:hypothetical protein